MGDRPMARCLLTQSGTNIGHIYTILVLPGFEPATEDLQPQEAVHTLACVDLVTDIFLPDDTNFADMKRRCSRNVTRPYACTECREARWVQQEAARPVEVRDKWCIPQQIFLLALVRESGRFTAYTYISCRLAQRLSCYGMTECSNNYHENNKQLQNKYLDYKLYF